MRAPADGRVPSPPVLRDHRFAHWLTAWGVGTMAVAAGGCFAVAAGWVPARLQGPAFWACLLAGLGGIAAALAPLAVGIRCRGCARRIFVAPGRPPSRRPPIRFYCPACDIEWDTGFWWGEE